MKTSKPADTIPIHPFKNRFCLRSEGCGIYKMLTKRESDGKILCKKCFKNRSLAMEIKNNKPARVSPDNAPQTKPSCNLCGYIEKDNRYFNFNGRWLCRQCQRGEIENVKHQLENLK